MILSESEKLEEKIYLLKSSIVRERTLDKGSESVKKGKMSQEKTPNLSFFDLAKNISGVEKINCGSKIKFIFCFNQNFML